MPNKLYVGAIYYKEEGDTIETLRVINDKDPNNVKCSVNGTLKRKRVTIDQLETDYNRLAPHGVVYFNTAKVGNIEDVIVMMYRNKDIENNESTPYLVCRQNITDIFSNTINPDYKNLIAGCAVSKITIPEGINMDMLLACDGIGLSQGVCVYMDDTLNTILSFIKSKPYDNILYNLFYEHVKYKYPDEINTNMKYTLLDGYSKTLKDLLRDNEFEYEFNIGFGIYTIDHISISNAEEQLGSLSLFNKMEIGSMIGKNLGKVFLMRYDKDIDLKEINRDYILFKDMGNTMYILVYESLGDIPIPVSKIETHENIQKMMKIAGWNRNKDIINAAMSGNG